MYGGGLDSRQVFSLRKEGRLEDALNLAVKALGHPAASEWDFKALGYTLTSIYKENPQHPQLTELAKGALQGLAPMRRRLGAARELSEQDRWDRGLIDKLQQIADAQRPEYQLLTKAREASKQRDDAAAVRLFYAVKKQGLALNAYDEVSFGWSLYRVCKGLLPRAKSALHDIKNHLFAYLKLTQVKKPDHLNSLMLTIAVNICEDERFGAAEFLQLFNLDTLAPEDYKPATSEQKDERGQTIVWEPLYEKAVRTAAKNTLTRLKAHQQVNPQALNNLLQRVSRINSESLKTLQEGGRAFDKKEGKQLRVWLIFYEAKLHLALGENEAALKLGMAFVQQKNSDKSWAWELLGRIYETIDSAKALTCLAQAACLEDQFSASLHAKLTVLLYDAGMKDAAADEYAYLKQLCTALDRSLPAEAAGLAEKLPEVKEADISTLHKRLQEHWRRAAAGSDDILYDALPSTAAEVGGLIVLKGDNGVPERRKRQLFFKLDGEDYPGVITLPEKRLKGFKEGDRLKVKFSPQPVKLGVTLTLCSAVKNEAAASLFKTETCVITYVNVTKKLYSFILRKGVQGCFEFSKCAKALKVGAEVGIKAYWSQGSAEKTPLLRAYQILKPERPADPSVKQQSRCRLRALLPSGAAFTDNDIFVPPQLFDRFLQEYEIPKTVFFPDSALNKNFLYRFSPKVQVEAFLNLDPKKNRWALKACELRLDDEPYAERVRRVSIIKTLNAFGAVTEDDISIPKKLLDAAAAAGADIEEGSCVSLELQIDYNPDTERLKVTALNVEEYRR